MRFVFTAEDLNPGVHEQWHTSIGPLAPETPRPPLAEGEVRFVGDPVALVIADDRYLAEDGADLVDVDYDPLPAVVDLASAEANETLVHDAHGSNLIGMIPGRPASTLQEIYDSAAHVTRAHVHQQGYAAVPMEAPRPGGRRLADHGRDHDLLGHPGPPRGAALLLTAPGASPSTASG